jgi:hypothetical protein
MVNTFTNPLQFLIFTYFIRTLSLGEFFAGFGKQTKTVFPQKKPIDNFRVIFHQGKGRFKAADRKLIGKFITHNPLQFQ